ncbi:hypothetical protein SAMN04487911_1026 [Arenibacter nanhaiticus]|uniref:Uncharacterized protein n=1 Tax=Arenibacter nanhaiticus TaxID=558155 RepID=A0A1M6AYQ4_9FLAO|nr:hypothetical protein [Arenibacter nanhaiticus]SHI41561.1 hypothetical protein SAMN04487911_1026 [Arenibacter nanhaiticus]
MKAMMYILLSVLTMVSSYGQVVHKDSIQTTERGSRDSSFIVQSQQNREVTKRFDEDGKIIGYDSIQIYSLTKDEKLPITMDINSLLNAKWGQKLTILGRWMIEVFKIFLVRILFFREISCYRNSLSSRGRIIFWALKVYSNK